MQVPRVYVGIDPGLVHTGLVRLIFPPDGSGERWFKVEHAVVNGVDNAAVEAIRYWNAEHPAHVVFIEDYRARQSYKNDPLMIAAVDRIKSGLPEGARLVNNSGSKKVIRRQLLKLLDLYKFPATHHQDLQAAARILVWGMLKHEYTNALLAEFVTDHLAGNLWDRHVTATI